ATPRLKVVPQEGQATPSTRLPGLRCSFCSRCRWRIHGVRTIRGSLGKPGTPARGKTRGFRPPRRIRQQSLMPPCGTRNDEKESSTGTQLGISSAGQAGIEIEATGMPRPNKVVRLIYQGRSTPGEFVK